LQGKFASSSPHRLDGLLRLTPPIASLCSGQSLPGRGRGPAEHHRVYAVS
jgi:hypothetical protein